MERKLQVTTANSDAKVTKTYNHFNTDLADSDCLVFAENLNMLSANTLKKVTRVDKTNITNATDGIKVTLTGINNDLWNKFFAAEILGVKGSNAVASYNGTDYTITAIDEITDVSSNEGTFTITFNGKGKASPMAPEATLTGVEYVPSWYNSSYHMVFFTDKQQSDDGSIVISSAELITVWTGGNISADFAALINQKASATDLSIIYADNSYTFKSTGDALYFLSRNTFGYGKYLNGVLHEIYGENVPDGVTFTKSAYSNDYTMTIEKE